MKKTLVCAINGVATMPTSKIKDRPVSVLVTRNDFWDFKLASRRNRRQRYKRNDAMHSEQALHD